MVDIMKIDTTQEHTALNGSWRSEHTLSVVSREIDEMINNALEELHWFCSFINTMMVKNIM